MTKHLIAILALTGFALQAQQPVAPTPEKTGAARGDNWNGYNITQSFETGYRFASIDGNRDKYRSDVNYLNGLRLLSGSFSMNSREGQGGLFDELSLSTLGLGNDPYQFSSLRIQKNKLYRYDMTWRLNDYYNPALTIANGQHLKDTERRLQDHDFILFPQGMVRILFGYSRNNQDGPALSTVQLFDSRGDEYPLFANLRRLHNEFRVGAEFQLKSTRFSFMRGWDSYREDTDEFIRGVSQGNSLTDDLFINQFKRTQPYRGNTPWWRLNLLQEAGNLLAVNARYTYSEGRRRYSFNEFAAGFDGFSADRTRQILVTGDANRPVSAGQLTLSLFPGQRLTVTNHTAFNNTRMEGNSTFNQLDSLGDLTGLINFQFLGVRLITNQTDAIYRLAKWASIRGGYQFSTRRIRSVESSDFSVPVNPSFDEQENRLHSGIAGIRLQPLKPLRLMFDAEVGRADRPFTPISEKNYHGFSGRAEWRTKQISLAAQAKTNYNFNSVSLFSHSSKSRSYGFDASWNPRSNFGFDAGYSKLHLDTLSGLAYFSNRVLIDQDRSIYISNIHTVTMGMRLSLKQRVDLYAGYNRVQDTGDGRSSLTAGPAVAILPAFIAAQTFPLSYQSPLVRLSVRIHQKFRWNFGYQFYDYGEEFLNRQNYQANTGYSSITWSF